MIAKLCKAMFGHDLEQWVGLLKIPLCGVYMLDMLLNKIHHDEMSIVNLDSHTRPGTHWVAYDRQGDNVYYFDPIGNLQPPLQLVKYCKKQKVVNVFQNADEIQKPNTNICGHLCL